MPGSTADTDRLRRINVLLEAAMALPEAERAAWLGRLPAEQQPLVPVLTAMLARAGRDGDAFMKHAVGLDVGEAAASDDAPDLPGDVVGPYRLMRELGAGGMATVWLAERNDGTMQRQVALKLPRAGWSRGLTRRMARERDILAALEHPRIARLYDAGSTAAGRPWLAMECVSGVPIDVYCRENALDVGERIRIFLQVADAVAHAHARLIAHRDLKPSNILVTAGGEVRLLDFGIAKLLEDEVAADASLTQAIGRAVTPDYASPEQVSAGPVTVGTDVYSLGIVLYELLTGQRPYRLGRLSTAALEEAILAADVALASSRVQGDRALARQLRGDLDTVLAKALRKDPARRYASVDALAADLQRYLDGEPVLAQAQSRRYRFAKFVRRNRFPLAAAGAVVASLVVGLGVALWQASTARAEAARAERVKQFIASIFKQAKPREGVGGAVTAADLLSSAAQRIETELAADGRVAAELGVMVGDGFSALGEPERGEAPLRAALARAERVFGRRHPVTIHAKALLIESLKPQDLETSERLLAELVPDALAGLPATAEAAAFALLQRSFVLAKRNRAQESYADLRQAVAVGEQHLGARHAQTIEALGLLSNTYGRFGEAALQLETATDAMQRAEAAFGSSRPHVLLTAVERWYGEALRVNDRPADAVAILRRVLDDQRKLDAAETPRVRNAMLQLAVALDASGSLGEALPLFRQAAALEASQNPLDSDDRLGFGNHLANALTAARRVEEAIALDERMAAVRARLSDSLEGSALTAKTRRAQIHALRGEHEIAARLAAEAAERAGDARRSARAAAWIVAAFNARMQGRPADALALAQRAGADPQAPTFRLLVRAAAKAEEGSALLDLGRYDQAVPVLEQSHALYRQAQLRPSVRMTAALVGLARARLRAGRPGEAEVLLRPLVKAWEEVNPGSAWHGEAMLWLARAESAVGSSAAATEHRRAAVAMLRGSELPALRRIAAS
ncbi:MAG: serine/threonine-protein kinase [Burkholderiales bacterium]|nr:serine/threonine-protein kinase [Burkholderiales bacterium]